MKNILLFSSASSDSSVVGGILGIFIAIAIVIALFLLLRKVVLWYWKIGSIEKLMIEQNEILKEIRDKQKN